MNQRTAYLKILPPTGLLIAVLLALGLHFAIPAAQIVLGIWRLLGILPLILGIAISYAAEKQFHQAGTTVTPFEESSQLVTGGLYRFSRNPMYLGMALVLLGIAFLLGSLAPFVMLAIFIGWIEIQYIHPEEEMLSTQFGQDWLEYKARVRRWL